MRDVVSWTVLGFLLLWMVRAGFTGPPRLFSWPMFSKVSECRIELADQAGRPINPWDHIVHQDPGMNIRELVCFLDYLSEVHGVSAHGRVTVTDHLGMRDLIVRDGHVVVDGDR